jgi:hypothetical protein
MMHVVPGHNRVRQERAEYLTPVESVESSASGITETLTARGSDVTAVERDTHADTVQYGRGHLA